MAEADVPPTGNDVRPLAVAALDPAHLGPRAGKRVVVAGGCGGMGRALVQALSDTGVQVAVLDQPEALRQHPTPDGMLAFAMDGSDAASVSAAFAKVLHYRACKAGIVALTKGLARENAPGVRVNAIAPGLTDTAFLQGGTGRPALFEAMDPQRYGARVPLGRVTVAEDMVGPLLFLLSDASRYVNGETMIVDGRVYSQ